MSIRDRIIHSCRDLAGSKGFYSLTVDELAAAAGISKRTLYRYFPSKEAIISATLDVFMQEMQRFFQTLLTRNLPDEEALSELFQTLLANGQFIFNPFSLNDLRVHYPFLWERLDRFRSQLIQEFLTYIIAKRERPTLQQINPVLLTAVVQASIQATINPDFLLRNELSFEEATTQLRTFWIAALL
ncbi:MAG TPA: TetR/AcrR family transcriptional regulator [Syntrophomonas sp.]|nr:TetR/AcrR family transcriptional regulator [Syntrophomonas sp.]